MRSVAKLSRLCVLAVAGLGVAGAAPAQTAATTPPAGLTSTMQTAPVLPPEQAAFRAALVAETAALDPALRSDIYAFYADRDYRPFWSGAEAARGAALLAAVSDAAAHGLPVGRYDPPALDAALAGAVDPAGQAAAEARATTTYLRYARDLSSGVLTPSRVDPEIDVRPLRLGRPELLARAAGQPMAAALAGLEPKSPEYRTLMAEKSRLERDLAAADWGAAIPEGGALRSGDRGPRVAALRARLVARGYAPPADAPATTDPALFDIGLEAAVRRFQGASGLEPDGIAGARTLAAVNATPEAELAQVVVNLERLRWMNRDLGPRYVYANIPDFTVQVIEDGRTVFTSKTVVGKAEKTRTPEFSDEMTYFVVNPTWHIPDSIAQRVYLPKLKKDPNTLAEGGMRLFTRAGTEINPALVDFTQFDQGNFPFRIKQNPSDANALGKVKFMFPNQFSIYLHDTPAREYFLKQERAYSNGCVRVEKPTELAELLLQGQVEDPAASFEGWVAAKSERTVNLKRPIPVHLVYRTVFVDEAGAIQRRFDVYGRDAEVFEALRDAGVVLPAAQG